VGSLIVQHKRQLWSQFYSKLIAPKLFPAPSKGPAVSGPPSFVLTIHEWEVVCSNIIGHHFPWRSLVEQLEIELVPYTPVGGKGVDFVNFLNRFKSGVRIGESPLIDTWEGAVVRGFFHEILSRDILIQQALLGELGKGKTISIERLKEILQANCPNISGAQASLFAQCILEVYPPPCNRQTGGSSEIPIYRIFESFSEYVRAYFSLIESAPDIVPSDEVIDIGRGAIDFFTELRFQILEKYGDSDDAVLRFYRDIIVGTVSDSLVVSLNQATNNLVRVLGDLGIGGKFSTRKIESFLRFISTEEYDISHPNETCEVSLLKFYAACYIDGSPAGRVIRERIIEHANSAIYFHRNALRVACVHMDKTRCGQIDRHSFHRAFNALNQSLDSEWKLSKHQQRCMIEYLRWQESEDDMQALDGDVLVAPTMQSAEEDKLLVIEYDIFLDCFEINDCQRMSRTCSFGWHLVKDTIGGALAFSLEDTIMQ